MAQCPLLVACIFFNDKMANMPKTAAMMKSSFCKGDNTHCARFMVFSEVGREKVPQDLFPGAVESAQEIILKNKKAPTKKDL